MTDQSHLLSEDTVTTFHHPQQHPVPEILAVTGCVDSDPARTTRECHFAGKINLILHGINFHSMCNLATPSPTISPSCVNDFSSRFSVLVGVAECSQVGLVSQYQINCTVEKAVGENLDVVIRRKGVEGSVDSRLAAGGGEEGAARGGAAEGEEEGAEGGGETGVEGVEEEKVVVVLKGAVSFKERINFRERFDKFVDMGVGGMKKEIDELYRRAFASRGQHHFD